MYLESLVYDQFLHMSPSHCDSPKILFTPLILSHFSRTPGMHLFKIFCLFVFYNLTAEADGFFENFFPPKAPRQVSFDDLFFGSPKFEQELFVETARLFQPSESINNFEDAKHLLKDVLEEMTDKSKEFTQELAARGGIFYSCKTCAVGSNLVFCNDCFDFANHKEHDLSLSESQQTGVHRFCHGPLSLKYLELFLPHSAQSEMLAILDCTALRK